MNTELMFRISAVNVSFLLNPSLNMKPEANVVPVKNVTWVWILMELPYHFSAQIDGSLVQIDTKFHDHSMSFV